jgi:hypothetical protein
MHLHHFAPGFYENAPLRSALAPLNRGQAGYFASFCLVFERSASLFEINKSGTVRATSGESAG